MKFNAIALVSILLGHLVSCSADRVNQRTPADDERLRSINDEEFDVERSAGGFELLSFPICQAKGLSTGFEFIDSVSVGSSEVKTGDNFGYSDQTKSKIALKVGSHPLKLVPGFRGSTYSEYWLVQIDFNKDGKFSDNETVFKGSSQSAIAAQLVVPSTAINGETYMRVSMQWLKLPTSCMNFKYGEVEDYAVEISGAETPIPPQTTDICHAKGQSTSYEFIDAIAFDSNVFSTGDNKGYFKHPKDLVLSTGEHMLSLTPGFPRSSYNESWSVYVDLDRNRTFSSTEKLFSGVSRLKEALVGKFSIPMDAVGKYPLRVVMQFGSSSVSGCSNVYDGEIEDFTLLVDNSRIPPTATQVPKITPVPPVTPVPPETPVPQVTPITPVTPVPTMTPALKVGKFDAKYFNGNNVVASETVVAPAINYAWGDFKNIPSDNFHAIWSGTLTAIGDQTVNVKLDNGWSTGILTVDGKVVKNWGNGNHVIPVFLTSGDHTVVLEFFNDWHTTSFNASFAVVKPALPAEEMKAKIKALVEGNVKVIYIGAYEPADIKNQVTVTFKSMQPGTPVFLFLGSYHAINWVINSSNVTIRGVAYNSHAPSGNVTVPASVPVFELGSLTSEYKDFTKAKSDIFSIIGRMPDGTTGGYNLGNLTFE
jgi:hypothetical protein